MSVDGTGQFSSTQIKGDECCHRWQIYAKIFTRG